MFSRDDYRWRAIAAVDVKEDNDMLRRGMIQDLVSDYGLIVDFDYPGHHRDVVLFAECVADPAPKENVDYEIGAPLETLFRRSSNNPWRWYPSKLLMYSKGTSAWSKENNDSYALVEIDLGGETTREVVAGGRVRPQQAPPYATWATDSRGLFYRHSWKLPHYLKWVVSLARLRPNNFPVSWNRSGTCTKIMGNITDGWLNYISRDKTKLTTRETIRRIQDIGRSFSAKNALSDRLGRLLVITDAADAHDTPEPQWPDDGSMASVPMNIVIDILTLLNTDDQQKCRQVCSNWNAILGAMGSLWVEIDLRNSPFRLASTLYKMATPSVETIVLNGNHGRVQDKFDDVFRMLLTIGIKVPVIVITCAELTKAKCNAKQLSPDALLSACLQVWRLDCKKLVLDRVKMTTIIEGADSWHRRSETSLVKRKVVRVSM